MLGGAPRPTPYDLNFVVWGFPVRVSIWFWLGTLLFGSALLQHAEDPGIVILLWIASCFVSILIHELGHTLAYRRYGVPSHIVLYAFGGLAIPDMYSNPWSITTRRLHPRHDLVVSAAGPMVQLVLAVCIIAVLTAGGYFVPGPRFLDYVLPTYASRALPRFAEQLVGFLLYINIFWALLNLLPVWPLDGGRIARSLFLLANTSDAVRRSLMVSLVVGGGLAVYGLMNGSMFMAILFGSLALSNYQELAMHGGGFGRGF